MLQRGELGNIDSYARTTPNGAALSKPCSSWTQSEATVDGQNGTGDVAGIGRCQEGDRGCDLIRLPHPLERDRGGELGQAGLAERGLRFVDSPIGRLASHADRAESLFMVGASDADFAQVAPMLEAALVFCATSWRPRKRTASRERSE